jgi:Tol biopolymer transport system component
MSTITRVSVDSNGNQGNYGSHDPSISADGRYVAFESGDSNLVAGDTNNTEGRAMTENNGIQAPSF